MALKSIQDVFKLTRKIRVDVFKKMINLEFNDVENWTMSSELTYRDGNDSWISSVIGLRHNDDLSKFKGVIEILYNVNDDEVYFIMGNIVDIYTHYTPTMMLKLLDVLMTSYPEICKKSSLSTSYYFADKYYQEIKNNIR